MKRFVPLLLLGACATGVENPLFDGAAGGTVGSSGGGASTAGGSAAGGSAAGGSAAGGSSAGGSAAGGSAAGGSAAGGSAAGGSAAGGATGGGSSCNEVWDCGPWTISNNLATRACNDLNACGTTTTRPTVGPLAAPALNLNFYKCNVHPVLQRSCASLGCHGTEQGRALTVFARGRLRNAELVTRSVCQANLTTPYDLSTCTASVDCDCKRPHTATEWQKSFDSARALLVQVSTPAQSELLTQPLAGTAFTHAGRKIFSSTTDPRYVAISNWLSGMTLATCTTTPN